MAPSFDYAMPAIRCWSRRWRVEVAGVMANCELAVVDLTRNVEGGPGVYNIKLKNYLLANLDPDIAEKVEAEGIYDSEEDMVCSRPRALFSSPFPSSHPRCRRPIALSHKVTSQRLKKRKRGSQMTTQRTKMGLGPSRIGPRRRGRGGLDGTPAKRLKMASGAVGMRDQDQTQVAQSRNMRATTGENHATVPQAKPKLRKYTEAAISFCLLPYLHACIIRALYLRHYSRNAPSGDAQKRKWDAFRLPSVPLDVHTTRREADIAVHLTLTLQPLHCALVVVRHASP
ncbi:hypothetical protein DFH09DRAFT_1444924 [Mycena vulgaris]|nr:hypothetical protein DFH09DRAFT_1444924 [Mycena vulgaris]